MHEQIYVNLAVDDLDRSKAFFTALGFSFEPRFVNEQAACPILGENLYAMLPVKDLFKSFTRKSLCNPKEVRRRCFMYGHGFENIDGHIRELIHMDPNAQAAG